MSDQTFFRGIVNRYEYRIKKLYIIGHLRLFIELCLKKHFIYHEIRVLRNKPFPNRLNAIFDIPGFVVNIYVII